jgi:flagellar FliL protein
MNLISPADDESAEEETAVAEAEAEPDGPALYQSLLPPLVINIKDANGKAHFMQMSLDVMSRDQQVVNAIRDHTPAIRNALILLFSNVMYEDVTTREGKEQLLADGLAEIRALMRPHIGDGRIEALYFTALVIQ